MRITMVGHSTLLLEATGQRILTDPYFGRWGNPAYSRQAPAAVPRQELLDVDLVLVSHNHWDHTDRKFLRSLPADVPVLAPRGVTWLTKLKGARLVHGMAAWEEKRFGSLGVTAVPALHLAKTVGFVLRVDGLQIYFAGDTYYRPFMREIGKRFQLDVALMPVTTFRIPMTMGERGAVRAARDLRPEVVIPIHLALQPRAPWLRTSHTPEGFSRRLSEAGLTARVVLLREGESFEPDRDPALGAGDSPCAGKTSGP